MEYDAFGFDATRNYKPLEWWEFEATDNHPDVLDISKLVADTVTSFDEQKVIIMVQGRQGAGKSLLALNLLWNVAMRLAHHRWGDLTRWREVYDYPRNTAIMLRQDCDNLIKNMRKGGAYLLDDVYDALSSDEWYTSVHKAINSIMIADRTDRTVTMITVPRGNWIDRIVRGIAGYRADVKRNVGMKRLGYNMFKFVILEWNEWDVNKKVPYNPYLKTGNTTWEDAVYSLPPRELLDWYKEERRSKLEALKEEKRRMKEGEEKPERTSISSLLYDWLHDNPYLLERKPDGKFYSSAHILDEFNKSYPGYRLSDSATREIIRRARKDLSI